MNTKKHSSETCNKISKNTKEAMKNLSDTSKKKYIKSLFKKGNVAWNKNLKGIHLSPETEFKRGQYVGEKHPSWKGGLQKTKEGYYRWIGANKRVKNSRYIYEKRFGEIPKGYVIYHKDGDKYNDSIDNLTLITRSELLQLNKKI